MVKKDKVRLGDVCTIVSGTTPKTGTKEYWDGELNWITPAELSDDIDIIYKTERKITNKAVTESSLKLLPVGTVLLSSRAPIGKVAIVGSPMYCNQGFKNLICSNSIFNKFLYWFLKGKKDFLNSLGRGATFKEISKSIVADIQIPLPPLSEQKKIAAILDKATELIALRKQQIEKLDLLVKSRFIEMFGDMGVNSYDWPEILLQEACRHPNDIKCGPFGTQLNKSEYQSVGVPLLGIPQINSFFNKPATDFVSEAKSKELAAYSLLPGDIAMSRKGNVGMCALYPEHFPNGIIHSDVLRIRINRSKFHPIFILMQLHHSPKIKTQVEVVSSGAIMAGINVTKLKSIAIYAPPLHLQEEFAAFVQKVDKSKSTLQQSLEKLELNYKALMQTYFG